MTSSLSSNGPGPEDRARALRRVKELFDALDASEPWEVEIMYAQADALLWVRDTAGIRPTPPRVAYAIVGAANELSRLGPCDDPTARLIEVAGQAVRDLRSSAA